MKKTVVLALGLMVLAFGATEARAGLLEFFFPSLKKVEPDPSQTLTAPFAEKQPEGPLQPTGTAVKPAKPLPENAAALDKPHRSTQQIADWLAPISAEIMSFESDDYNVDLKSNEKFFDANGRAEYLKFLEDNSIKKVLDLKKYYVRSYVKDLPLLLNEGAAGGRYHWLFEIPVNVSYMDRGMKDYNKGQPINQMVLLKVQVGRSPQAADSNGIVIEHWSGKGVKLDKK